MDIGMVGLGRMGGNMARRLAQAGHRPVGFDPAEDAREEAAAQGIDTAASLRELVEALAPPRAVWLMVPAGEAVERALADLHGLLGPGDTLIEGGNSFYGDSQRRAREAVEAGLRWVDVGTSGGVWGLEEGYSLMVGGTAEAVEGVRPILETLAPAPDRGWAHVGPAGAGHFVKMVHNGIEYGLMQAYAEGFHLMAQKEELGLDLAQVAEVWRHGSVVRSWLLDLLAEGLRENPGLEGVAPWVPDSGEGRWTVKEAIDLDVPAPVITLALQARLRSRVEESPADKLLSVLRGKFGGHEVRRTP